jgi:hypothetical protein
MANKGRNPDPEKSTERIAAKQDKVKRTDEKTDKAGKGDEEYGTKLDKWLKDKD